MVIACIQCFVMRLLQAAACIMSLAFVVLAATDSQAQSTITENGTFTTTATNFGYNTAVGSDDVGLSNDAANGSATVSVAQYNPAAHPGMFLEYATVSWTATASQSWSLTNTSGSTTYSLVFVDTAQLFEPPTGTTTTENTEVLDESQVGTLNNGSIGANGTANGSNSNVEGTDGTVTIPGPNAYSGDTGDTGPTTWTNTDLLQYSGTGNVVFDVTGLAGGTVTSGNGNVSAMISSTVAGTVSVTYTYTVPEPSSWAFMGIGVISTGLILRKRKLSMFS